MRVQLRFPDALEEVEDPPKLDGPPRSPRFKRRTAPDSLLHTYELRVVRPDLSGLISRAGRHNVSAPRYRRGSLITEIKFDKLLHGVPEETEEPLMLRVAADGGYVVPWEATPTTSSSRRRRR